MLKEMKSFNENMTEIIKLKTELNIPSEDISDGMKQSYLEITHQFGSLDAIVKQHLAGTLEDAYGKEVIGILQKEANEITLENVKTLMNEVIKRSSEADEVCGTKIIQSMIIQIFTESFEIIAPAMVNDEIEEIVEYVNTLNKYITERI